MIFFLEIVLPAVALLIAVLAVKLYIKIQCPSPLVWGRIIPRVSPVRFDDVLEYNEKKETDEPAGWRLRREARRQRFSVNWEFLSVAATNTALFLRALRFEKMKIDPAKPGLNYEPREIVILELIDEATELRWKQVRWQLILRLRARLGLNINKEIFLTLLAQYKKLEGEIIGLADMEKNWFRGMLVERLGLMDWQVIEGGSCEPDPA